MRFFATVSFKEIRAPWLRPSQSRELFHFFREWTQQVPSLKLTTEATENGWLEYYHFLFPCTNHQWIIWSERLPRKAEIPIPRLHAFPLLPKQACPAGSPKHWSPRRVDLRRWMRGWSLCGVGVGDVLLHPWTGWWFSIFLHSISNLIWVNDLL